MAGEVAVQVVGAKELRRSLKKAGDDLTDLREVHRSVLGIVMAVARPSTPYRTGRLQATVRGSGTKTAAVLRAGNNKAVPYAKVIAYGWPRHNIEPQPWLQNAAHATEPVWFAAYQREIDQMLDKIAASTKGVV